MAIWRKGTDPIDRVVADLDRQILEVQRQMRQLAAADTQGNSTREAEPASSRAQTMTKFVKDMLTPPPKGPGMPSYRTQRDRLDAGAEPLKDLEAEPIAFAQRQTPDLLSNNHRTVDSKAIGPATAATQIDCSTKPDEKLAHYLSAGSIKTYKPLKRVQRQTRNRFFMWIGLSFVALWLIYAVVR